MKRIIKNLKKKYSFVGKIVQNRIAVGAKLRKNSKDLKYGFVDEKGLEIVPLKYDVVWDFCCDLARVGIAIDKKMLWGMIDKKGNRVLPTIYKSILPIDSSVIHVQSNEKDNYAKWGILSRDKFEQVLPLKYDWIFPVKEGICIYRIAEKFGAANIDGTEVIPLYYQDLKAFSQGLCAAKKDNKWGLIDKENKIIVPFEYDMVWPNENGIIKVYKDGKYSKLKLDDSIVNII